MIALSQRGFLSRAGLWLGCFALLGGAALGILMRLPSRPAAPIPSPRASPLSMEAALALVKEYRPPNTDLSTASRLDVVAVMLRRRGKAVQMRGWRAAERPGSRWILISYVVRGKGFTQTWRWWVERERRTVRAANDAARQLAALYIDEPAPPSPSPSPRPAAATAGRLAPHAAPPLALGDVVGIMSDDSGATALVLQDGRTHPVSTGERIGPWKVIDVHCAPNGESYVVVTGPAGSRRLDLTCVAPSSAVAATPPSAASAGPVPPDRPVPTAAAKASPPPGPEDVNTPEPGETDDPPPVDPDDFDNAK